MNTQLNTIAEKNDHMRKQVILNAAHKNTSKMPYKLFLSQNVAQLAENDFTAFTELLASVAHFQEFTPDNDPYGEHDFGSITLKSNKTKYFWKIDYYDQSLEFWSDPKENDTVRVMTIMEACEY